MRAVYLLVGESEPKDLVRVEFKGLYRAQKDDISNVKFYPAGDILSVVQDWIGQVSAGDLKENTHT